MRRADKPIRYEIHALRRMQQRGISEEQVEKAIRHPDADRPARRAGARRLEKAISRRKRLAVITEEEANFIRAVSAFWM